MQEKIKRLIYLRIILDSVIDDYILKYAMNEKSIDYDRLRNSILNHTDESLDRLKELD